MKFYLHIGTHKTGSTALQNFLHRNRELLLRSGIYYPDAELVGTAHHSLAWTLKKRPLPESKKILDDMVARAEECGARSILISSEEFEFIRDKNKLRLLEGRDVKVVVYLRRQDRYLESEYNQHVKMPTIRYAGDILSFYFNHDFTQRFNYNFLMSLWEDVVGLGNLKLINYDECLSSGDKNEIYKRFLNVLGISDIDEFDIPGKDEANESLSGRAILHLARLNSRPLKQGNHLKAIELFSAKFPKDSREVLLDSKQRQSILSKYRSSNDKVFSRHGVSSFKYDLDNKAKCVNYYEDFNGECYFNALEELCSSEYATMNGMSVKTYVIGFPNSKREKIFVDNNERYVFPIFSSAVDGYSMPDSAVMTAFEDGFVAHQLKHQSVRWLKGTFGCFVSHISALEKFIASGDDYGLISEDDALYRESPIPLMAEAKLQGYDLVFFNDRMLVKKDIGVDCDQILEVETADDLGTGAESYFLSARAAKIMIDLYSSFIDVGLPTGYDGFIQSFSCSLNLPSEISKPGGRAVKKWLAKRSESLKVGVASRPIVTHNDKGFSYIKRGF